MTSNSRPPVDRFPLSNSTGYSCYWRRNYSPVESYELARLLQSLRKVTSYIGRNVGTLVWSGMKGENQLVIDPAMVMGSYPVPAEKTDRATGVAVRLAYGKVEWSQIVKDGAQALQREMHPRHAAQFAFYIEICEKVYLDIVSNTGHLGIYTEAQRLWAIEKAHDSASHPPGISELLHYWWQMAADRSGEKYKEAFTDQSARKVFQRTSLEKYYKQPLALLNSMVGDLIHECPRIRGVMERSEYRLDLYLTVWKKLFDTIKFWAIDSKDKWLLTRKINKNILDFENEEQEKERGTSLVIPELIEKATFKTIPVLTDEVKQCVENQDEVVSIEGNDIAMPAPDRINSIILHRLSSIFRLVSERNSEISRGQKSGKVDRRRLYRASTVGTIFKLTKVDFELRSNVAVLVDATGSMSATNKWENAEMVYQTLYAAIHNFNKRARLWAYNEIKGKCLLTEIYLKDKFYNVLPHGKTASGEAIIATVLSLKGPSNKSYILHITDGASNWGCGVKDAISLCQRRGIKLLTLGIGCSGENKNSLMDEYGRLVAFLDKIEDLPRLMSNLFKYSQWS